MRSYRNLDIWQKSLEILRLVYNLSNKFPESEKYGLTVQIKRAVVSILSNIAEGSGRNSNQQLELIDHYCRMNKNFQNYLTKKNNGTK